jgi:hypothetical protein
MHYQEGEMYYRLVYPGVGLLYPLVQSFIYVGKNLSDEDTEDTWYFQYAEGYAKYGSILESKGGDRAVCMVTESDIGDMLDLEGLVKQLKKSAVLRKKSAIK